MIPKPNEILFLLKDFSANNILKSNLYFYINFLNFAKF